MLKLRSTQSTTEDKSRFMRAFLPTWIEAVVLCVGSFFILLALNTVSVLRTVRGETYTQASELIGSYIEKLLAPTNNQQGSQILTVLFWMVIGIFAYLLMWVITSLIKTYNSDVRGTKRLVIPQGSSKKHIFNEYILRLAVRLLATIMFIYWIYLILAGILPYASITFLENITHLSIEGLLMVIWSTIVLAGSVFVAMIFARCIVLRERVFEY